MNQFLIGLICCLVFVIAEALQFVYFGSLFQDVSSLLFGTLVFFIVVFLFVGGGALLTPKQFSKAIGEPKQLALLNLTVVFAWLCYLTAVEFVEPAVVYTISSGVMPIATFLASKFGLSTKASQFNRLEQCGMLILGIAVVYLTAITIAGYSGFTQSGTSSAIIGCSLAILDGLFFTWMLVYSGNLNRLGVGPSLVLGLRFPLYVIVAGSLTLSGVSDKPTPEINELWIIIVLGLLLTVPHLFAIQVAVSKLSTALISALTTLGPFIIFALQVLEGRVTYSNPTLIGLCIYAIGSILCIKGSLTNKKNN